MNEQEFTAWFTALSSAINARADLTGRKCEISIGYNTSLPTEATLTIRWWDERRADYHTQSIIYPPNDWKDGLNGLLDDLLKRTILRAPPKPIPLPSTARP